MSNKKECPEFKNIHCLSRFWKKFTQKERQYINEKLEDMYQKYISLGENNNMLVREYDFKGVVCICPGLHVGGDTRIVSIHDIGENKNDIICLVRSNHKPKSAYTDKLKESEKVYIQREKLYKIKKDSSQNMNFMTNKEEILQIVKCIRPLIEVGFYKNCLISSEIIKEIKDENKKEFDKLDKEKNCCNWGIIISALRIGIEGLFEGAIFQGCSKKLADIIPGISVEDFEKEFLKKLANMHVDEEWDACIRKTRWFEKLCENKGV